MNRERHIRWSDHTILQHGPLHDLEKIQPVLMIPLSTEVMARLVGGAYRWPGLDKPEGPNPPLRFLAPPHALTVVLVR